MPDGELWLPPLVVAGVVALTLLRRPLRAVRGVTAVAR